ncbi:MAG: cytochrome c biogenesis protein ResB, partial [Micrococcales bacterium]|nr:cytochrome c biogenesis protein ResB [Micrococcales bacterium]
MTVDITTPEATDPGQQDPERVSVWEMFRWVYRFFYSKTLGMVLILAMAVLVLVGTFRNELNLSFDVYRSPVFVIVAALLCLSILACTAHRLPRLWKNWRHPRLVVPARAYERARYHAAVPVDGGSVATMATVREVLKKQRYRVLTDPDHPKAVYADRYSWGGFGAPVAHLSFVIIVIALVLSMTSGIDTMLLVPVKGAPVTVPGTSLKVQALSYSEPRSDAGRPEDFVSRLVVLKNDKKIAEKDVRVNSPLQADGVRFHQSDRRPGVVVSLVLPDVESTTWRQLMWHQPSDGLFVYSEIVLVEGSKPAKPAEGSDADPMAGQDVWLWVGVPNGFSDPVRVAADPSLYSENEDPPSSFVVEPGQALLRLGRGRDENGMPLMVLAEKVLNEGETWQGGELHSEILPEGYAFTFVGSQASPVLRVRQDPGEPWMWAGAILLVVGMTVTFACRHRRLWVTWDDTSGQIRFASTDKRDSAWTRRFRDTVEAVAAQVGSAVENVAQPTATPETKTQSEQEAGTSVKPAKAQSAAKPVSAAKPRKNKKQDAAEAAV